MRRREFISLLGGAAAWPFAARAQQPLMPVVGFLIAVSPDALADRIGAFRKGLQESGYIEGQNVTIEYRWAENQIDRLPILAAELVRRGVAVIATVGEDPAFAAKAATITIPIVFAIAQDPVKIGLVASLARPGGNVTGVNFFAVEVAAKRLNLLRELVPGAKNIAVLVNPATSYITDTTLKDLEPAARALGLQLQVFNASSSTEIDSVFAALVRERADALFVSSGAFFTGRRVQLVNLASRYAIPAIYSSRANAEVGGLISYGANIKDAYRQVGVYAGRILKGAKPADMPVEQSSKFQLVINSQTARMLGLTIPPNLLALADEVIE